MTQDLRGDFAEAATRERITLVVDETNVEFALNDRTVRDLLGYTGQQPRTAQIAEDIDEDLLLRVVERGPIYRDA